MMARARGALYVVATPIGNLSDLTMRALEVLRTVDVVFAEDTRHTRKLLARYGIDAPLVSAHAHNERQRQQELLRRLERGDRVALVTDAGSPGVADPGAALVGAAAAAGYVVAALPGPSATTAALAISGFPADVFSFAGFLPPRPAARTRALESLLARPETLVFFEAPHRVRATLELLARLAPERRVAACRELTKSFEEVLRGTPAEVLAALGPERERGEWTFVLAPIASRAREERPRLRTPHAGEDASDALARTLEDSGIEAAEARRRADFIYGRRSGRGARTRHGEKDREAGSPPTKSRRARRGGKRS